tara:strand:- start:11880 stop:12155 length:276 start_codon:yes stop_codon:yes gene_type:complete
MGEGGLVQQMERDNASFFGAGTDGRHACGARPLPLIVRHRGFRAKRYYFRAQPLLYVCGKLQNWSEYIIASHWPRCNIVSFGVVSAHRIEE